VPKLSFITTGRNDNYDGNFIERLSTALRRNIKSLPDAEFIFVEWNPFLDRPLVCEELKKIFRDRVRYYVVHPKYHKYYCNIDEFLEYPAKNVGVRHATGEYICCTNSDIVFCPDLVHSLKTGQLSPIALYRATRIDIRLDYLHVTFPLQDKYILEKNYGPTNAAGDFLLMHKNLWKESTAYCEEFPWQRLHKDAFIVFLLSNVRGHKVENIGAITHWRHPSSWSNGRCRAKIGDVNWNFQKCGYKKNKDTWGLSFAEEEDRDGIIWLV
jgi:glycosyltransferase involved in cell wall biosynthesis